MYFSTRGTCANDIDRVWVWITHNLSLSVEKLRTGERNTDIPDKHGFVLSPPLWPGGAASVLSAVDLCSIPEATHNLPRGRYHGGRRPSSDDSLHSPTVIPPSALDKPSIMKRYHRRRTCSHTSPRRSPLSDTRFVECRWWNDGWTVKTVVT